MRKLASFLTGLLLLAHINRLNADGDDLLEQTRDVFGIVGIVRITGNAAARVLADLVLISSAERLPRR